MSTSQSGRTRGQITSFRDGVLDMTTGLRRVRDVSTKTCPSARLRRSVRAGPDETLRVKVLMI